MARLFSHSRQQNKQGGFLLLELVLSLLVALSLLTLLCQGTGQLLPASTRLRAQLSLYDVGHYMLSILEKNLVYEGALITVARDSRGKDKLICQTVHSSLSYVYTLEGKRLYKTINKASSSGKNPLFVSTCYIADWSVQKIGSREIAVELLLEQGKHQCQLRRIFSCLNGRVEVENEA